MATEPPIVPTPADAPPSEPSRGPWIGLAIGLVIIVSVIAYLIYSSRTSGDRPDVTTKINAPAAADPHAADVALSDAKLSTAQNGLGGTSIYIEGTVTNKGAQTIAGASVEVTFKNSLGQTVQRQSEPLMVFLTHEPADDLAALNMAPLKPGASKEFRLTFERVSADWNQQMPEVRVTTVTVR
jgi:hypothetical protein